MPLQKWERLSLNVLKGLAVTIIRNSLLQNFLMINNNPVKENELGEINNYKSWC